MGSSNTTVQTGGVDIPEPKVNFVGFRTSDTPGVSTNILAHRFNVLDFGAVADADVQTGYKAGSKSKQFATDNRAAFIAAYNAAISAGGGTIYIPAGIYYFDGTLNLAGGAVPVEIEGEYGDGWSTNTPAVLIFPAYMTIDGGVTVHRTVEACVKLNNQPGSRICNLTITQPQAVLTWAQLKAKSIPESIDVFMIPTRGFAQVIYHGRDTNRVGVSLPPAEPDFPREWDIDTRFNVGDKVYVASIIDPLNPDQKPWRYKVTAVSGDQKSAPQSVNAPYTGSAPTFQMNHGYALGDIIRPTDAKWTGKYHECTMAGLSGNTEATWDRTEGNKTTQGAAVFTTRGPLWPRSMGLEVSDHAGKVTFQLDETNGLFNDGAITWEVLAPVDGLKLFSSASIENIRIYNVHGNGVTELGATGTFGDGWYAHRVTIVNVGGHGFYERGGDVNVGIGEMIQVAGYGGVGIYADAFLGSTYRDCQVASQEPKTAPGRYSYRCTQLTAKNVFIGCYRENTTAPAYLQGPSQNVSPKGVWSFFPNPSRSEVLETGHALRVTPHHIITDPLGAPWATGRVLQQGQFIYPSPPNGKQYQVQSIDGDQTTGTRQPVWPTQTGTTVTEKTATAAIVYQCLGTGAAEIVIGDDGIAPGIGMHWSFSDLPGPPATPYRIQFACNVPNDGWVGFTRDYVPGNTLIAFDYKNFTTWIPRNLRLGVGGQIRDWTYNTVVGTVPVTNALQIGSIGWNNDAKVGDPVGWYALTAGAPNAYAKFGDIYSDDHRKFVSKAILWTTGTASDGTKLPNEDNTRNAHTTTNATPTTIDAYLVQPGAIVIIEWRITATQTAGVGAPTFASWKVTAAYGNRTGVVTVVDAPVVTAGSANSAGPILSAPLIAGQGILLNSTGVASKTFGKRSGG